MTTVSARLVSTLRTRTAAMVDELAALVAIESPSSDLAATHDIVRAVDELGRGLLGVSGEIIENGGHTHLRWRFGTTTRVVLIGHLDTVWPMGTHASWPFTVDDGIARGPGAFDMKAGVVQMLHALAVLDDRDGVAIVLTTDEELGSQTSCDLVVDTARDACAALVLEPSGVDGALKTARKGVGNYELHITGRAAHAGLEPENGVNAIVELAHQIIALEQIANAEAGTTVTPTVADAGSATNVVPAAATVALDVRTATIAEQDRVDAALRALSPAIRGSTIEVTGGPNRPPLPASASAALFLRACDIADQLGLARPAGIEVGGGSDGNFTAAAGTPTLDGLGAVGGGAHARDEHVMIDRMPERAALVAALIADLLAADRRGETVP